MDGRAVFTTEMSSTTRICAVSATASTVHDLRGPSSSLGGCAACGSAAVAVVEGPGWGADSVRLTRSPGLGGRKVTAEAGRGHGAGTDALDRVVYGDGHEVGRRGGAKGAAFSVRGDGLRVEVVVAAKQ